MALLSLLFGKKNKLQIANIEVDVCVSESHETDCDITENPVESGAYISDHVQLKPARLTIEGLVSDTPISLFGLSQIGNDNRARKVYDQLLEIQYTAEPIDIITGLTQYSNMVLKTLTVPRNSETGKTLRFNAVFQEIIIIESSEIAAETTSSQFTTKTDTGKVTPKTPGATLLRKAGSLLSRITGLGA